MARGTTGLSAVVGALLVSGTLLGAAGPREGRRPSRLPIDYWR